MARFIKHTTLPVLSTPDPAAELRFTLTKLVNAFTPGDQHGPYSFHGLYSGPTSIAYLLHNVAKFEPHLLINDESPGHWCQAYLAEARPKAEVTPKKCGVANETLAYLAVRAACDGKNPAYVEQFLRYIPSVLADTSADASNEWLYGRAGTLYLLRIIRNSSPHLRQNIDCAIASIIDRILSEGPPWPWHGKTYLGAVHGSMGILTQIALSSPAHVQQLQPLLEELLTLQRPQTGNWPSSIDSHSEDRLVQFCHGAPGFAISLAAIRPHFASLPNPSTLVAAIDTAIEKGRDCIYARGLLKKQPCLCHGVVGNALAFDPHDERGEVFMRWCAGRFIERGLMEGWFDEGNDPWGLYCGEAGRAWAWLMMMEKQKGNRSIKGMIGYDDV